MRYFHMHMKNKQVDLCTLYSAASEASGANMHSLGSAIHLALYALNIGVPDCIASSMRMADIITEMYALAANITLSHLNTSLTHKFNCDFVATLIY